MTDRVFIGNKFSRMEDGEKKTYKKGDLIEGLEDAQLEAFKDVLAVPTIDEPSPEPEDEDEDEDA